MSPGTLSSVRGHFFIFSLLSKYFASTIALFIQIASQYDSSVYVEVKNKKVNAKSIMGMMTLGLNAGESVVVSAEGTDEQAAIENIEKYLSSHN